MEREKAFKDELEKINEKHNLRDRRISKMIRENRIGGNLANYSLNLSKMNRICKIAELLIRYVDVKGCAISLSDAKRELDGVYTSYLEADKQDSRFVSPESAIQLLTGNAHRKELIELAGERYESYVQKCENILEEQCKTSEEVARRN